MNANYRLINRIKNIQSNVCVGLDPDPKKIPTGFSNRGADGIIEFLKIIIDHTADYTAAYKLNLAFFEAFGEYYWKILKTICSYVPADIITIADGKRGDIGNSARFYADAIFGSFGFDFATVNPYMGYDSIAPFISNPDKGVFVLTLTSNPGAEDFQFSGGGSPLYERVAQKAAEWNINYNVGLVTGATRPEYLIGLRRIAPDLPFLIPGIGAQGGDLEEVVKNTISSFPAEGLINSSRGIIYASSSDDFGTAAGAAAKELRDSINSLKKVDSLGKK